MKKYIVLFLLIYSAALYAQDIPIYLQAPTSPAASILDMQPKVVLSPKTYQTLETALFSNFIQDYKPVIPNDFALEFTPYWVEDHRLSLNEYLYPKSITDQFIRNLSLSLASTQTFKLGDSTPSNSVAFGLRTTFYFGNNKDRDIVRNFENKTYEIRKVSNQILLKAEILMDKLSETHPNTANKDTFLLKIKPEIYSNIYSIYDDSDFSAALTEKILKDCDTLPQIVLAEKKVFFDLFKKVIDKNLGGEKLFNDYKEYIRERYGFTADIAYANFLNFPSNDFEFAFLPRQSLWITLSYRLRGQLDNLVVSGVLRYDWYHKDYYRKYFPDNTVFTNNLNYGLEASARFRKIFVELELVGRTSNSFVLAGVDPQGNNLYRKEHKSDFQYIGSVHYNLTDQIVLSYNLGNRFELVQNQNSTLVSLLTLNFGFGAPNKSLDELIKK